MDPLVVLTIIAFYIDGDVKTAILPTPNVQYCEALGATIKDAAVETSEGVEVIYFCNKAEDSL